MSNKVSWIFLAQDQYSAVAAKVAASTQGVRDKFAGMGAAANKAAEDMNALTARAKKASESMVSAGKSMSLYVSAPAALFAAASMRAYDQEAKALAQVEAAIASTGGAAKLSIDDLVAEASRLEGKTVFGDDTILKDVTSRLLAFTNITGDTFKRTQEMALDLSTALGKDLGSSAMMLGKALDDPVQGLTALSKAGVRMDPAVEEYVKVLWTMGKKAEAQQLILNTVAQKFGGRAEAAAKAGLGPLQQLGNSYNNFQENVGKALLRIFTPLINVLKDITDWLNKLSPETTEFVAIVAVLLAALGPVVIGLGALMSLLPVISAGFAALSGAVAFLVGSMNPLVAAFMLGAAAGTYIYNTFEPVQILIADMIDGVVGLIDKFTELKDSVSLSGTLGKLATFFNMSGDINSTTSATADINVNLRAPQGAVESVKSRSSGAGMNVGVNMEFAS
jgi:hypothetical protein